MCKWVLKIKIYPFKYSNLNGYLKFNSNVQELTLFISFFR